MKRTTKHSMKRSKSGIPGNIKRGIAIICFDVGLLYVIAVFVCRDSSAIMTGLLLLGIVIPIVVEIVRNGGHVSAHTLKIGFFAAAITIGLTALLLFLSKTNSILWDILSWPTTR